ncbi:MAG TPA: serine/threonine-protein kinase [Clostridia bacterium]|nr:serine/threonine-protein kinase [Clostridia bacterium]
MDVDTAKEQSLFEAALEINDPAEREAFLTQSCAGNLELRNEVAKLLAAHARSDRLFSPGVSKFVAGVRDAVTPTPLRPREAASIEKPGLPIGRYKILQPLGEGGCGMVYLAEQEEPVRRRVALKIIKLGMDTKSVIARFEAERQALALMDHPNIAKVLDAGATESGRPYFVMELVRGIRITKYCDEHRLGLRQRLLLFIQVCQAIQHAHQKGVVHRDIKPSNILVTVNNNVPMPKVIDFGIAKAAEGRLTDNPAFTVMGQLIGTPAYMSPEQVEMGGLDVDTRSDIYSLGVLLYELLTGRTPFDQKSLVGSGFDAMRRTLLEQEPPSPSAMLASLTRADLAATAECRRAEPAKLSRSITGDLDWIVMKALEKDRTRRYETADGLAMDIQRFLDTEPVLARPPSQLYRLRKLICRNRVVFASGTIVILTLIMGLGASTWLFLRERESLRVQGRLRQEAEQARANEMQLRQKAEAREKVTEAGVLASHQKMQEADNLLEQVPAELFSPSMEATTVFRNLGTWNTLQGRWKQAADRFSVLVQVNKIDKTDQTDRATSDLLLAAPLLIEAGNLAGYDRMRRMELVRLAGTPNLIAAEQLLKTSLMVPAEPSIMAMLEPLAELLSNSLASSDPAINDSSFYAAWRALALALLEYRRGNYAAAVDWLEKCEAYPSPAPSCVATRHILLSMAWMRLGKTQPAETELDLGRQQVQTIFANKLELNGAKSGLLAGWLMARILLREAEELSPDQNQPVP